MALETEQNFTEPTEEELEPYRNDILVTALNSRLKLGLPLVLSTPFDLNPGDYPFLADSVHKNGSATIHFTDSEVLARYLLVRNKVVEKTLKETRKRTY